VSAWQPALPIVLYARPSFLRLVLERMTCNTRAATGVPSSSLSDNSVRIIFAARACRATLSTNSAALGLSSSGTP
jgi:hypothetical protein